MMEIMRYSWLAHQKKLSQEQQERDNAPRTHIENMLYWRDRENEELESVIISKSGDRLMQYFDIPEVLQYDFTVFRHKNYDIHIRVKNKEREWDKENAKKECISLEPTPEEKLTLLFAKQPDKYNTQGVDVFITEMRFIAMLYFNLNKKPTKKELNRMLADFKKVQKHLSEIDEIIGGYIRFSVYEPTNDKQIKAKKRSENKASFLQMQDWIINQYRLINPDGNIHIIKNFWHHLTWINEIFKTLIDSSHTQKIIDEHNGRGNNLRDSAIRALADSYEKCFEIKPTCSHSDGKPCFYECVLHLNEYLNDRLIGDMARDALKNLINSLLPSKK